MLLAYEMRRHRNMLGLGVGWQGRKTNESIRDSVNRKTETVMDSIRHRKLLLFRPYLLHATSKESVAGLLQLVVYDKQKDHQRNGQTTTLSGPS